MRPYRAMVSRISTMMAARSVCSSHSAIAKKALASFSKSWYLLSDKGSIFFLKVPGCLEVD